ncbi:MAG TPA: hypothetical protein VF181_12645 [Balneolaceae bacterium]
MFKKGGKTIAIPSLKVMESPVIRLKIWKEEAKKKLQDVNKNGQAGPE